MYENGTVVGEPAQAGALSARAVTPRNVLMVAVAAPSAENTRPRQRRRRGKLSRVLLSNPINACSPRLYPPIAYLDRAYVVPRLRLTVGARSIAHAKWSENGEIGAARHPKAGSRVGGRHKACHCGTTVLRIAYLEEPPVQRALVSHSECRALKRAAVRIALGDYPSCAKHRAIRVIQGRLRSVRSVSRKPYFSQRAGRWPTRLMSVRAPYRNRTEDTSLTMAVLCRLS